RLPDSDRLTRQATSPPYFAPSKQPDLLPKAITESDFMGIVIDAPVQCLVARTELVAVTDTEVPDVDLRHSCYVSVTPNVHPQSKSPLHKEHRCNLRLRAKALRIRDQ